MESPMRIRFLLPLLLLSALAAPALGQTPSESAPTQAELQRAQQRAEAWHAYGLRVATALGRSGGARDLALAALLEATAKPSGPGRRVAGGRDVGRRPADAGGRGVSA